MEKTYIRKIVSHLTKKQRKDLVELMRKKGFKFEAIQGDGWVFSSDLPTMHGRVGFLK